MLSSVSVSEANRFEWGVSICQRDGHILIPRSISVSRADRYLSAVLTDTYPHGTFLWGYGSVATPGPEIFK